MAEPSVATGGPQAVPPPSGRYRDHSGRDMARSLLVLLVPILLIGAALRACGSADPSVVDTAPAIADARAAALFEVTTPHGLPDGWQPVQASFRRAADGTVGTLRLGYLTPSGGQLLLVVSNEEPAGLLARELGDSVRPDGQLRAGGTSWTRSVVRGDEWALVDTTAERTVIVVGRAPADELAAFAGSLS